MFLLGLTKELCVASWVEEMFLHLKLNKSLKSTLRYLKNTFPESLKNSTVLFSSQKVDVLKIQTR